MKKSSAKRILSAIGVMATLLTACGNADANNKETIKEPSTRVDNSAIGKWYHCVDGDWVDVWVFEEDNEYYSTHEDNYGKEDETFEIVRSAYSIEGNSIILDGREATIEYTNYGLYIKYVDDESERKLYEYRQDALESTDRYLTSDKYYETLKDENGYVIEGEVLIKYFTNDSEITVPKNVTEIGSSLIVTNLEHIDKITIPGNVKKIGMSAFNETSIRSFVLEEGVEEIGDYAFADSYWDEIHIPASVEVIGEFAFDCSEGNSEGKIYVKKGSYADKYFSDEGSKYSGKVIVLD